MSNKIVLVYIKDYGALNDEGNWYNDRYLSYVGVFHDIKEAHKKQMELRESMNREHDSLFLSSDLSCNNAIDAMCEFEIQEDISTNGAGNL
jgi:hypothetical protein